MDYSSTAVLFKAFAHPVRLHMLDMLRGGELCVCHIEAALQRRQAYISQQLRVLREAGLVASRKDGLRVYYRLADPLVADMLTLIWGPADTDEPEMVADCPCPQCTKETQNATD